MVSPGAHGASVMIPSCPITTTNGAFRWTMTSDCLRNSASNLSNLDKRENFRAAFAGFDFNVMADFTEADVERLVQDKGIIRHRGKINAVINNAARAQEIVAEFGSLARFVWSYEPPEGETDPPQSLTMSPASHALSKEMKKRGWKFVGPTTIFAFMQSMGLFNDHAHGCSVRPSVTAARQSFARP